MSERSRGDLPLRKADLLELGVPTALLDRIAEAVSSTLGVLLEGETGTGKTHLAQLISDLGPRADKPFILQNCAALPEGVFAAELFGHTRGAFTGAVQARRGLIEAAHKGTLFLDEIAELWPEQQAALLDALDRGMFRPLGSNQLVRADLRLITATNRNLLLGIRNRTFRQDLYHRCAVIHLRLPPLRERNHEIPTLITRLLGPIARKHALENGHETFRIPEVSPDALSLLRNHPLPGNIRDLQHALSLAVVRCNGGAIEPEHLRDVLDRLEQVAAFVGEQSVCDPVDAAVPDASPPGWARRTPRRKPRYVPPDDPDEERRNIRAAKARAGGNISEAARLLGITRQGLYSRMRRLCLGNGNPSKEMLS